MKIQIKRLNQKAILPKYQHGSQEDAGMDLCSSEDGILKVGEYRIFKTGIAISLPSGYMAKVAPRSGLALKHGITVLNAEGTIDPGYRGELGILLINHGQEDYQINIGDRIAQLIIEKYEDIEWDEVEELSDSQRGTGGYGHTGV